MLALCGVGVLSALAGLLLQGRSGELAALLRIGGLVLVAGGLLLSVRAPLDELSDMVASSALSSYVEVMLKGLGIALLCAICTDVCRECGAGGLAGWVELGGNLAILALCLPIIRETLGGIGALLEMG